MFKKYHNKPTIFYCFWIGIAVQAPDNSVQKIKDKISIKIQL